MHAVFGNLTTRFGPSMIFEHDAPTFVKLLPVVDLSYHVERVLPVPVEVVSAASNHSANPGIFAGEDEGD